MTLTPAEAIAIYQNLVNPPGTLNYQRPSGIQPQIPAPPSLVQQLAGPAVTTGIREGIKSALAPSTTAAASEGLSASAIDGLLGGGQMYTPISPETFTSSAASTLAPDAAGAATDITNFAGTATPYLGAAGAALGAYGAYKGIKDKNPLTAGLGGLGAGLGINAMGYTLGPYGWAAMIAAPAIAGLINKMGDKDRWKIEGDRLKKLQKSGTFIPENLLASMPTSGRSKGELLNRAYAADFVGRGANNEWINNKFSQSRNEIDLRPEDIVGYSAFAEKNKDWFNLPLEERLKQAKNALDAGAVRERRGTIDVDWNKVAGALAGEK